jgi:hypothetical protein
LTGTFIILSFENKTLLSQVLLMLRKARLHVPGAPPHAVLRGIERCPIFGDGTDREDLLKRLGGILRDSQPLCFAWSLILNHFHLLLRTGLVPISNFMRRLMPSYAGNYFKI